MANFQSVLDTPAVNVEKPKPIPVGTYLCVVAGAPKFDKTTKKQTDYVEFTLNIAQPQADVDQEQLTAMGGASGKQLRLTFYLTEDALYRLRTFLEDHLGIEAAQKTIREMISEAPGHQVMAVVTHAASEDGQAIYANVKSTARV